MINFRGSFSIFFRMLPLNPPWHGSSPHLDPASTGLAERSFTRIRIPYISPVFSSRRFRDDILMIRKRNTSATPQYPKGEA
jgi:hypothetical protein